ncbi:2-polyprenyl-3-methyl-6-methoxy-1,4-benzoquinone monooxygenase [soil metagenome]
MDRFISGLDKALRVVAGISVPSRPNPAAHILEASLSVEERRHSAGLMRVNHTGEVCAQALYDAQGQFSQCDAIKQQFEAAGREEEDHLAWTAERLSQLGSHPSVFNPLWYAGAFAMGAVAARLGPRKNLAFVVETERQVEAHLASHLKDLPAQDVKSKAIVEQMRVDEAAHGAAAKSLGASEMSKVVSSLMTLASKVMIKTAYRL